MKNAAFSPKAVVLAMAFVLFMAMFTACTQKDKDAPKLPPIESMVIDFTKFPKDEGKTTDETATKNNFGFAAVNVGWWSTVLVVNLAIPVAAFYESFNHDATYSAALEKWTWTYSFNAGGMHTARLEATLNGIDEVHWEMYISKAGAYSDFLWFSGNTKTDESAATWQLMKNPTAPVSYININYARSSSASADIRYTLVEPGIDSGSYIEYGATTNPLNAFYNIYLANGNNLTNINWNTTSKEGRVKSLVHFGNDEWQCWNTMLEDTEC